VPSAAWAAILAAFISAVELAVWLRKVPPFRSTPWIIILLGFDAAAGLFAFWLLGILWAGTEWLNDYWKILIAGLIGPAILRAQLALIGSGQEDTTFGPANRVGRLRKGVLSQIDDLSAAAQSRWASKKTPKILACGLAEFRFQLETYLHGREDMDAEIKAEILMFVEEVCSDQGTNDDQKCRAIVIKLLNRRCRAIVQSVSRRPVSRHR